MFSIQTDHPFCYESEDYKNPLGSRNDYHSNPRFLEKVRLLFRHDISLMDLGCANGSQVVECLNNGIEAVGIDGSDYGVKNKTGGWGTHPYNFFNADLTKPFSMHYFDDKVASKFCMITAWDVLEHISEQDLPQFLQNVKNHMDKTSLFFAGIAMFPCGEYHRTVKNEMWWREQLKDFIIYEDLMKWWTPSDYVCPTESPDRKFHVILGLK